MQILGLGTHSFDSCDRHWTRVCFTMGPASTKSASSLPPVLCSQSSISAAAVLLSLLCPTISSRLWCPTPYTLLFWLASLNVKDTYSPDCGGTFLCRSVAYICSSSKYLTSALQGFAFESSWVDVHEFTSEGFRAKREFGWSHQQRKSHLCLENTGKHQICMMRWQSHRWGLAKGQNSDSADPFQTCSSWGPLPI